MRIYYVKEPQSEKHSALCCGKSRPGEEDTGWEEKLTSLDSANLREYYDFCFLANKPENR